MEENYKVKFCEKYFDKKLVIYEKNNVDITLLDKNKNPILYIESKYLLKNEDEIKKALAQIVLTNKKQENILNKLGILFLTENKELLGKSIFGENYDDNFYFLKFNDDSIMFNNDINWKEEKPSSPIRMI